MQQLLPDDDGRDKAHPPLKFVQQMEHEGACDVDADQHDGIHAQEKQQCGDTFQARSGEYVQQQAECDGTQQHCEKTGANWGNHGGPAGE